MVWVNLDFLPIKEIKNDWVIIEHLGKLGVELTDLELQELATKYIWVKIQSIQVNLRHLTNEKDNFLHNNIPYAVLEKDLYDFFFNLE